MSLELPSLRYGTTFSTTIAGSNGEPIHVHVRVNEHRGRIVELFVDVDLREGSAIVEMAKAVGKLTSHALRAGADVESLINDLIGTGVGPAGDVRGCDGITHALSVADLVGQVLQVAWMEKRS